MNNPWTVIQTLENDNSRLAKEEILKTEIDNNNQEFFHGCRLAYDALITFGVKQIAQKKNKDGTGLDWQDFYKLAQALINREITGNDARDAVDVAMNRATKDQWNSWYRRILIKDLRCGISEKTINKVLKNTDIPSIPVFDCMLAHDGANHETKIQGKKILEPKLDGVRVITVINYRNRTVTQYSRNGKVLENFTHITESLEKHIDLFERDLVLDGEMISDSFQSLMKQVHRKKDVQSQDARLMLFDIIPLSEFLHGKSTLGQRRRSNLLRSMKAILDEIGGIDIIEQKEVDLDSFVGDLEFKDYNKWAINQGYEGIMIKDPDAKYECKRSTNWLKIKPSITVDLTVVSLEEGTGKNQGKLGALICEGTDQGKFIRVNVGSGLTDEQRDEIWGVQQSVIGQIVEIRADAITQNQNATDNYSLRFPRFLRFRGFKAGEKI